MIVYKVINTRGYRTDRQLRNLHGIDGIQELFYLEDQDIWICEIFAIKRACIWIIENAESHKFKSIDIYIDCLSAIMALKSYKVISELVWETKTLLNMAAECLTGPLTLKWVKAHVGYQGNEKADELAKTGASDTENEAIDAPKISKNRQY